MWHRSCSSNLCPPWQRGGGKRDFTSPRHCGRGMALGCSSPLLPQRGRLGCTQASWTCFFGGFLGGSWAGFEDVQRKMCLILVIAGRSEVCWVQILFVWRMQSAAGHGMMAFDYSPVFWRRRPSLSPVLPGFRWAAVRVRRVQLPWGPTCERQRLLPQGTGTAAFTSPTKYLKFKQ